MFCYLDLKYKTFLVIIFNYFSNIVFNGGLFAILISQFFQRIDNPFKFLMVHYYMESTTNDGVKLGGPIIDTNVFKIYSQERQPCTGQQIPWVKSNLFEYLSY